MIPLPKIVGLCGTSGSGKTQTCRKLIKELRSGDIACCGFISPAVFGDSEKTAIKVQWLGSGEEQVLMTPVTKASQITFRRWQIFPQVFEWINQELTDMQESEAFFSDEIGPLEVLEGKGWIKALEILDKRENQLSVVTFRPSLRDFFSQRYPDMTVYDLDIRNEDEKVIQDIKEMFGIA